VKRVLLAFALAIAVTGALFSQGAPAVERASFDSTDGLEAHMIERLNTMRARRGLRELRISPALSSAAHQHSVDMARKGYCEHQSVDGAPFRERISRYYRRRLGWRYWAVAENLLCHPGRLGAAAALGEWLDSPGHRANLLSAQWREVGLAAVYTPDAPGEFDGNDVVVVTADFGVRR
jgi:uncharacterized protein YkwD